VEATRGLRAPAEDGRRRPRGGDLQRLALHPLSLGSDALRGTGIGRALIGAAERRALERGCHSAWVDTFSFQAPGFYRKLGYKPFGELDYPPDFKRIFLQKRLTPAPA
jgi:GNAT superfamily N-acetyltransferase